MPEDRNENEVAVRHPGCVVSQKRLLPDEARIVFGGCEDQQGAGVVDQRSERVRVLGLHRGGEEKERKDQSAHRLAIFFPVLPHEQGEDENIGFGGVGDDVPRLHCACRDEYQLSRFF